ncbi:glycosyltransferase family 4 protein [Sulfurimonas sp. HSL1-2]|uniref:glycosyltransferase family 4 protein n=1 Tax=Thiomicrolovo zhangzhouensis TaxID=3131933 RepID=UPI0031F8C313
MKLLFVHDHIFVTGGGKVYSNTFPYELLRRYIDMGLEVTVVARCRETGTAPELPVASGSGVSFVFLENIASFKAFFGARQRQRQRLTTLVATHDYVIARVPSEFGLMAAAIARRLNKPCLLEVVGCAWDAMWYYGSLKARLYAPLLYVRMRRAVRQVHYVSYVTEGFLQHRYPPGPNAMTAAISDIILPDADEAVLRGRIEKINHPEAKPVLGTIANLGLAYKGVDVAIRAMAVIKSRGIDIEYRVLGGGDPDRYRALAARLGIDGDVHFDGNVPGGDAVYRWLDAIDLYLQPSLTEGLPRSLIEAMSRGCPAVGANVGGIPELLDETVLFRHTAPQQLVSLIIALLNDRLRMRQAAKRNFDVARQYENARLGVQRRVFLERFFNEQRY